MGKLYNYFNNIFKKSPRVKKMIIYRKNYAPKERISIITNNCLAGCIYHDYGMRFETPLINCFVSWLEFPDLVLELKGFMESDLVEHSIKDKKYPCGFIEFNNKKINVNFNHSNSFLEAKQNWIKRKERINNEMYITLCRIRNKNVSIN